MVKIVIDNQTVESGEFFQVRILAEATSNEADAYFESVSVFFDNGMVSLRDPQTMEETLRRNIFFPKLREEVLLVQAGDPGLMEVAAVGENNTISRQITVEPTTEAEDK